MGSKKGNFRCTDWIKLSEQISSTFNWIPENHQLTYVTGRGFICERYKVGTPEIFSVKDNERILLLSFHI